MPASSDLVEMVESENTKSGWLSKRGTVNKMLKRRWVTVQNGNLDYFTQPGSLPSGSIPLRGAHVEKSDKENQKDQFFFYLTPAESSSTKKNEDRVYVFCCDSAKEVEEWLTCFEDCDANVLRSLKEGALQKCNRGLQHWIRRYFVLYYDRLVYFKDRTDTVPNGVILFSANDITISETGGDKGFAFQIEGAEADDGKTCTLSASTEDDRKDWLTVLRKVVVSKGSAKFPGSIQEGYLSQCHKPNWRWGVRYVVVVPGKLLYYRHKAEETEEGVIDLTGRARLEESPAGMLKRLRAETKGFTFSITESQEQNPRVFYFATKKREDLAMWLAALRRTMSHSSVQPSYSNSVQEGFLKKSEGSLTIWAPRYFALFENRYCYFKSKGDLTAAGEILLTPGFEAVIEPDPANPEYEAVKALNLPFMFSIASSGDEGEKRLYVQAADFEERTMWLTWFTAIAKAQIRQVRKDSLREGYVRVGKNKRFYILCKDRLLLYKKRGDELAERELLLTAGTVIERDSVAPGEGTDSKVLCQEAEGDRKLNLDFFTRDLREEWMAVVGGLEFNNFKTRTGRIREGWGRKLGAKFRTWKARYFVLFEDKLCYYSKLRDTEAAGTIELNFSSKVLVDPTEEMCLVIEHPTWSRVYKLQFDTLDSMNKWLEAISGVIKGSSCLFGGNLEDHCKASCYPIPKICFDIGEKLKAEGLDAESLFRAPGNPELIQGGIAAFEGEFKAGKGNIDSPVASVIDPYSLAWILVVYLRRLRIPLIPPKILEQILAVDGENVRLTAKYTMLATLVNTLPAAHRILLVYVMDLLQQIVARASVNKMPARLLATTLTPIILRKPLDEHGSLQDRNALEVSVNVLVMLIEGFATIFPTGCPPMPIPMKTKRDKREEYIISPGLSQRFDLHRTSNLPEDWQPHVTDDGIPYYYNTLTNESTWIRPEEDPELKAHSRRVRAGARGARRSATPSHSSDTGDSSDDDVRVSHLNYFDESTSSMMSDIAMKELRRQAQARTLDNRKRQEDDVPRKSKDVPLLKSVRTDTSTSTSTSTSFMGKKPPLPPPASPSVKKSGTSKS